MARSNKKTRSKKTRKAPVLSQSARPAKPLFRLIPLTMTMAGALLCLKTIEIYQGGRSLQDELLVSTVLAEETTAAEEAALAAAAEAAEAKMNETGTEDEKAPLVTEGEPDAPVDVVDEQATEYNPRELDILENLSERRKKLDQWEKEMVLREKVLQATEQRIDQKLSELESMSAELKELLVTYEDEEDAKVSSLVKVYEAMKPKDAARIFDELDMDILLMVVDRMSERRVAPVLAAMSPQKAKEVTQQLADQQRSKPAELNPDAALDSPPLF